MGPFRGAVSYVEVWVYPMPITAKSAHSRRKIGMAARRLSIWEVLKLTCSMNVKSMDLRNVDDTFSFGMTCSSSLEI